MLAGIRDILIISTPQDVPRFENPLGDRGRLGINLHYAVQARPEGLRRHFLIASEFISSACCALVLGDNIFYGHDFAKTLLQACEVEQGARVFAYPVQDPERYGVVEFDDARASSQPGREAEISKIKICGYCLYFYDNQIVEIAKSLKPSARGELEITDVNKAYLERGQLDVVVMGRGLAWLDTGTHQSMLEASLFIQTIETRQGLMVACPEEIAYRYGYITAAHLEEMAEATKNHYGAYLLQLVHDRIF